MLTYMEVHLYFTLPVVGLLYFILKPFHSKQDNLKYQFLTAVAVTTASLWDNYIVYHKAWSYCPTCVVAVIGYVPLEEYMFFVIQTLMTVSFSNLVMRWHLPTFYIKPQVSVYQSLFVRFIPIFGLLTIAYKAWNVAIPGKSLFYGGCILWYVCPVLALLWYGAGEYILRRPLAVLTSIVVPTIYLCWVDRYAIRAGTWDISLQTSTGKMVVPHLPLEEFMFFALINTVLVFAACAIDRAQAILHLFKTESVYKTHTQAPLVQRMSELCWAFCLPDQMLNNETLQDLSISWDILKKASKSFYTASAVFSSYARQDLGILYGFCRATDDLCDDESVSVEKRKEQLNLTRRFVQDIFSQKTNMPVVDWEFYNRQLPSSCVSAFKTFTRLRHILHVDAIEELLEGYEWDLERKEVRTQDDLYKYSACVASSVGEMCTRILLFHDYRQSDVWIIARAREMGLVLQLTNIARDIVTDSQELGRCYLPMDWLTDNESSLIAAGKARELGDSRLLQLSKTLIRDAESIMKTANKGIEALPFHCRGGVRAACNVYAAIGHVILKERTHYPTRAHIKSSGRSKIALLSVYDLYKHKTEAPKSRQGKIRGFMV
ncbi:hypothetical protein INT47_003254 [Mucor saturninus]|uniref:Bifunctional lycopene cyclase/phytoene synthase n=1 Tax=Mucor saturninus TaxID=64648 RepID=A0A8H7RF36_9FUNG|nr:hypothetical protein INT47_003254 [Mucor saturninus]